MLPLISWTSFSRDCGWLFAITEEIYWARLQLAAVILLASFVLCHFVVRVALTPFHRSPSVTAAKEDLTLIGHRSENRFGFNFVGSDCSGSAPSGYSRIFIAHRTDNEAGTGTNSDPFNGSTAGKFDALLRARSESGVTHLVVCIGPGIFQTEGTRDTCWTRTSRSSAARRFHREPGLESSTERVPTRLSCGSLLCISTGPLTGIFPD